MDEEINTLRTLVNESERIVVFSGAGISTESGIPDFRSPGGLWTRMKPIDYQEFIASEDARRRSWELKLEMDAQWSEAKPNRGHRAVAELVGRGKCFAVITQNVDGLHQAAGVPGDRVIELHGNNTYALCVDCRRHYELAPIVEAFRAAGTLPICDHCGGIVKTATVSFGEAMPEEAMRQAREASVTCDLCLVLGSSLVVWPAAGFPQLAVETGARLAIVNREPTDMDDVAALTLRREIGDTLGEAVGIL